jgi:(p)ppGpp synthase/HD superfamily hydrolase
MADIIKAVRIAEKAHRSQFQKYTDIPYITHPIKVAEILSKHTHDHDTYQYRQMICVALLHDVLETDKNFEEEIKKEFGPEVFSYVLELTPVETSGNRHERHLQNLIKTAQFSQISAYVKLADIISSCSTLFERDARFAQVYFKEKLDQVLVLKRPSQNNPPLYNEAYETVATGLEKVNSKNND